MNILKKVEDFSKSISGKIFANYSLKKLSWFGLGGSAYFFFKPNTLNELVLFLKQFGHILPFKVIGAGSNILIRDGGFKGTIIKLGKNFSHISRLNDTTIVSGSIVVDKKLSEFAMNNSISGFEFLSCIPGTIGGAIRMNSGCYGYDISKSLVSIQAINMKGVVRLINADQINYKYRSSDLPKDLIFLSATLKGKKVETKIIKKKIDNFVLKKKQSQPSQIKTCGSTFRNPINKTKKKSWQLIKEAGCEKMIVGGAYISEKHANFFVNDGSATSNDVEDLINIVKEKVLAATGIKLDLELEVIGNQI